MVRFDWLWRINRTPRGVVVVVVHTIGIPKVNKAETFAKKTKMKTNTEKMEQTEGVS